MSRHISHLTLTHPSRVDEADVEVVSGHFRNLEKGDALVRTSTALRDARTYSVTSVRRERIFRKGASEPSKVDIEFIVAEECHPNTHG